MSENIWYSSIEPQSFKSDRLPCLCQVNHPLQALNLPFIEYSGLKIGKRHMRRQRIVQTQNRLKRLIIPHQKAAAFRCPANWINPVHASAGSNNFLISLVKYPTSRLLAFYIQQSPNNPEHPSPVSQKRNTVSESHSGSYQKHFLPCRENRVHD